MREVICIVLLAAIYSACGTRAVELQPADVCSSDNAGKYVSTSGYLDDKDEAGLMCTNPGSSRMTCRYSVLANPGGAEVFSAFIEQGKSKNQAEKPSTGYRREDLKIRDDNGSMISLSDRV